MLESNPEVLLSFWNDKIFINSECSKESYIVMKAETAFNRKAKKAAFLL